MDYAALLEALTDFFTRLSAPRSQRRPGSGGRRHSIAQQHDEALVGFTMICPVTINLVDPYVEFEEGATAVETLDRFMQEQQGGNA
jgi:hypothetical protein